MRTSTRTQTVEDRIIEVVIVNYHEDYPTWLRSADISVDARFFGVNADRLVITITLEPDEILNQSNQ